MPINRPVYDLPLVNGNTRAFKSQHDAEINRVVDQLVDNDGQLESLVSRVVATGPIVGEWDASTGAFPVSRPGGGAVQRGDTWRVTGDGVVDGQQFYSGDYLQALVDGGGATFNGNWARAALGQIEADRIAAEAAADRAEMYADLVQYARTRVTFSGDGTNTPLVLPIEIEDENIVQVFVNQAVWYADEHYTVDGYEITPVGDLVWPHGNGEINLMVQIDRPIDVTSITTSDVTHDGTVLSTIIDRIAPENKVFLRDYLHPDDAAAIIAGTTATQNATRVTAAIRAFHEAALTKTLANDGAQVAAIYLPGIYRINGRLMSDAFNNALWNVSAVTRSRLWFSVDGSVTFRIQSWVDGRAAVRTDGLYNGTSGLSPVAVWEWHQSTGRQNFAGFSGQFIIEGANSITTDPVGWHFYRLNATATSGHLECRNLRNTNFAYDSTFNSVGAYVRSAAAAGLMLTEAGGSGLLPADTTVGSVLYGLRYTVSGTTLTTNLMEYNSALGTYSYTPANVFLPEHAGLRIALERQGRTNVLGDDTDDGNEGGSSRRSAKWFTIASVTNGSTVELTEAPAYQDSTGQWVPQNRTFSFGVLRCSTEENSPIIELSVPISANLIGLEVTIPGAYYQGGPNTLPNLTAMVIDQTTTTLTLNRSAREMKTLVPLICAPQVNVGPMSQTYAKESSRKTDDFHIGRLWCESGNTPALPLHIQNCTNVTFGDESKLHGSPNTLLNFGANFAVMVGGEIGIRGKGRFTHSRHSPDFGMFYLTGDRSEVYLDTELSSWTADDVSAIFYLDPANEAATKIWAVYFNAGDYAYGFPDAAAGQVFARGGANFTPHMIKAGASQRNPRGEHPIWPPAEFPPTTTPAVGTSRALALSAQGRGGWVAREGFVYTIGANQFLGVPSGEGTDGFATLKGLKVSEVKLDIGQSNEAGNGTGGSLWVSPRVYIFDTDASVPSLGTTFNRAKFGASGTVPINKTSGGLPVNNAGVHAASQLADDLDVDVYLIKVARGGVPIESFLTDAILTANGWSRGAWPDLSGLLLDTLEAALPLVPGAPTKVSMIETITGEANRTDAPTVYAAKYMALMTMLSDAGYVDLKTVRVVHGEISTNGHGRYYENHKAALAEIDVTYGSTTLPGFVAVSSVGVEVNTGDETHYSGPGLVEYGRRIANAALGPTIRSAGGTTRAHYEAACARGWRAGDGQLYWIDGRQYRGAVGATAIAGLPSLVPVGDITLEQFGWTHGTNATSAILAACQYAASVGVQKVYLPSGTIEHGPLDLTDTNTRLVGKGMGKTILKYVGAVGSDQFKMGTSQTASFRAKGIGFEDLTIDANSLARRAVEVTTAVNFRMDNVEILSPVEDGLYMTCLPDKLTNAGNEPSDNQRAFINNVYIECVNVPTARAIFLDGNAGVVAPQGANTSLNHLQNIRLNIRDGDGLVFGFADGNTLIGLFVFKPAGFPGRGLVFKEDQGGNNRYARCNMLYNVQTARAGVYAEGSGVGQPSDDNAIIGFNLGNAGVSNPPIIEPSAYLQVWSSTGGQLPNGAGGLFVAGSGLTAANAAMRTVRARMGAESLRVSNRASLNLVLERATTDNTSAEGQWTLAILGAAGGVGENLRFQRGIGTGMVEMPSVALAVRKLTGGGTTALSNTDTVVLVDATGGNRTLNLPAASSFATNRTPILRIKRIDSDVTTVTINANGANTINGSASITVAAGASVQIVCDAAGAWFTL